MDRANSKQKSGVFTGAHVTHPISGEQLPLWTADYVLASYGTGVVMAVPAHDERDFEFATAFQLPIKQVVVPNDSTDAPAVLDEAYIGYGVAVNSGIFDGLPTEDCKREVIAELTRRGKGEAKARPSRSTIDCSR